MRGAVIADDLTGALEMGALLTARRLRTLVTMRVEPAFEADAIVIDTESRNIPPVEAADRVRRAARRLPQDCPVFKKIDSTLRGPIAAELEALTSALGGRKVYVTPAYPRFGRVVRGGCLYIDGVPVAESAFATDPRFPVRQSHGAFLDAETEEDLERIVENAPERSIFAGSGGLGRVWAGRLDEGCYEPSFDAMGIQRPVLVCGSRHPVSVEQARQAACLGVPVVLPNGDSQHAHAILEALAESAARVDADCLLLFGGDTAAAVLRRAGIVDLTPVRELLPGIVLSQSPSGKAIVTKAGGFGGPDVVERILGLLK